MEFSVTSGQPEKQSTPCVVVGVFQSARLSAAAKRIDAVADGLLDRLAKAGDLAGKSGQTRILYGLPGIRSERVLVVGCGKQDDFNDVQYRKASAAAMRALGETGAAEATSFLTELAVPGRDPYWQVRQAVEAAHEVGYRYERTKSKKDEDAPASLGKLSLGVARGAHSAARRALKDGSAIALGVRFAKELANLPPNLCTPVYLAEQALELHKSYPHLVVDVLDEARMEELGMGSLLSVARGSRQPARLAVVEHRGGPKEQKPVVLVGKGLTFDAGGISLKPSQAMDEMKYDMCGAAGVLGAMAACAERNLPLNVVAMVACAENLPDGNANRPGDIVTSMSGQTIEILNTDAEGRLVLCDALTYSERFEPDVVIDAATLTGACVVALGKHPAGLFSNHAPLAAALRQAGDFSGDRAWELPLWDDYQSDLDSNFADVANIGGGRAGGAITAACFLSRFAKKLRWAHLDIAGVAWKTGKEKGATGRPVPLLTQFLLDRCATGD